MAAAGRGTAAERSYSPAAEPPSPLCLALLRSACRTVAVDGTPLPPPRDDTAGGITADVITDGPRRSRPLAEPGDADAFFEYDLEGGAAPAGVLGSSNGGGGADTGCSLTSPAEHTDGSGDGSPCPTPTTTPTTTPAAAAVATATAAAAAAVAAAAAAAAAVENGLSLRRVEGADTDPEKRGCTDAGNGCDSKRHLYENPLASVPVAVPGAGEGGRRGRHGVRDVTSRPQQSPSEKVDAWLLTCDDDVEVSEETSPAPAAAVDGEDEDEDEDEDTEDALTDADELDICELLTRGCELLELERSHAGAAAAVDSEAERPDSLEFACAPGEPRASVTEDEPEDAPDENEDEGNGSESGVSSEFLMADRLKRSSSLKSGKTPPLTPGRKKYVRFADALGLDLQQVRTFRDEIPTVPHSAFLGLDAELFSSSPDSPFLTSFPNCAGTALDASAQRQLVPMFLQPSSGMGFEDRLRRDKVCLVSVTTHEEDWSVRGVVRVLNMDYYKTVCVRYTLDEWRTWSDAVASYVHGSCDGFADRFHFTLYCSTLSAGQRLHFAIVFRCQGQEFWDNNHGNDYTVMCALQSRSMPDDWGVGRF